MTETTSPPEPAASTAAPPARHPFSALAYAQLVRLPNVFTALADIGMAALVSRALPAYAAAVVLLLLASSCLYCAGMVWNDYFDQEQDRRERPFRPLPSGRASPGEAVRLAGGLMAAGAGCAFLAGSTSFTISLLLIGAVLLYDCCLKRFWAGPIGMGVCRF